MKNFTSLNEIEKITNGDRQAMKELLEVFIKEASLQIQKLGKSYQTANWDDLKKIAHKIKSSLMLIGLSAYRPISEELERSAGKDLKKTGEQTKELIDVYTKALAELKIKLEEFS